MDMKSSYFKDVKGRATLFLCITGQALILSGGSRDWKTSTLQLCRPQHDVEGAEGFHWVVGK